MRAFVVLHYTIAIGGDTFVLFMQRVKPSRLTLFPLASSGRKILLCQVLNYCHCKQAPASNNILDGMHMPVFAVYSDHIPS